MKKTTVTIGIPAYNEAKTIKLLLQDILSQQLETVVVRSILVISDGSNDKTVKAARSIKNPKVHVYERTQRLGKAARQNEIFRLSTTDAVVLLDADIRIPDKLTIEKIVAPIRSKHAQLTSGAITESTPKTLLEDILTTSMKLKSILFRVLRNGNNVYHCHGPIRAFSKKLYSKFRFEVSDGEDMYSYFACVSRNMKFSYVSDASVMYRLPNTISDHTKQSIRYAQAKQHMSEIFDTELVTKEFSIPFITVCKATLQSFHLIFTHPLQTILYVSVFFWLRFAGGIVKKQVDTWSVVSTKII